MTGPYNRQIAGDHYLNMGIQPFQFAMRNGWDSTAFSILKYVSRHRTKNGKQDLFKAEHIVEIRLAEIEHALPGQQVISMGEYIRSNTIGNDDAWALHRLDSWVHGTGNVECLQVAIGKLIADYDTEQTSLLR